MSISDGKAVEQISEKNPAAMEAKPGGIVSRWVAEIGLASKAERDWRKECQGIWQLYRGGGEGGMSGSPVARSAFPILWSNTETMRPALFNSMPKPDVRRRFRDEDPLGKIVADVVERSLYFCSDTGHLYDSVKAATLDTCLVGRGTARVRYAVVTAPIDPQPVPGEQPGQVVTNQEDKSFDGEAEQDEAQAAQTNVVKRTDADMDQDAREVPEKIVSEGLEFEHVQWDEWRRGPGKTWSQVKWIAFKHRFDYDELGELVGDTKTEDGRKIIDLIPLDASASKTDKRQSGSEDEGVYKAAEVWEIWDKRKRQVIWICDGYKADALRVDPDPLKLRDFFPLPRPAFLIEDSASLIPVPVYRMYRDQARELEDVTKRIDKIIASLKIRGLYHPGLPEMEQLLDAGDNEMLPVTNTSTLAQMKSLDDAIWIMPVEKLAAVLQNLYTARQQIINVIYQITGISDIMRGDTKASETLGAQEIKSKWGTVRLQRGQEEMARFARDLIALGAEVVCTRFRLETLKGMTGLQLPMQAELDQAQQVMQKVQQMQQAMSQQAAGAQAPPGVPQGTPAPGQPPQQGPAQMPPAMQQAVQKAQQVLSGPQIPWEAVLQVMHSDMLMQYKTDIESDSTIAASLDGDTQALQQVLTGVSQFLAAYMPMVQQKLLPVEAAKEIVMAIVRRARLGRAVEDALDKISSGNQQNPTEQELQQVGAAHEQLVQSAAQVGKKHAQQVQQLVMTDQTVTKTFQGLQQIQQQFGQMVGQVMQQLNMQKQDSNVGPQLQVLNASLEQFKHDIATAAQEGQVQNAAPAAPTAQGGETRENAGAAAAPKEKHGISGGGQTKLNHGAIAGGMRSAGGMKTE